MTSEHLQQPISPKDMSLLSNLMGEYVLATPEIVDNRRESVIGRFPAAVDCIEDEQGTCKARVFFDSPTFSNLENDYCDEEFTPEVLTTLYIEAGVVGAALRRLLNPSNLSHLETIHHTMASPDSLSREILTATEDHQISDDNERNLLLALHEGQLVPDIALINGIRLSMGTVFVLHGISGEKMKGITQDTMRSHLVESLRRWPLYRETRRILGDSSREETRQLFMNSLPLIEIAGSFPMPTKEIVELSRAIVEPEENT